MTGLEQSGGLSRTPERDWREDIIRRRLEGGFTPTGFLLEPDIHVTRMDEKWGEIYEYEGCMDYANEHERGLAETNRALIAWEAQNYGWGNVAVELVPPVFEKLARKQYPSAYPLRNYRIVMVRRPQVPVAKAA